MTTLTAVVPGNAGAGHGESFIWKQASAHPNYHIVAVDAGRTINVGTRGGGMEPTILILSHDDHDHIGGAISLITKARGTLRELWAPVDWALLIKQIETTGPGEAAWADGWLALSEVEELVYSQLSDAPRGDSGSISLERLTTVRNILASWVATPNTQSPSQTGTRTGIPFRPYGALSLDEIVNRVKHRAGAILAILEAAQRQSIRVRFFSIDVALAQSVNAWETEGEPGTATLANAAETPGWSTATIPRGIMNCFTLTQLTVQNRRALCTYLWAGPTASDKDAIVWSDTDGQWLNHLSTLGLGARVDDISLSSAPHHASGNSAHSRVWTELARHPRELFVICAGGQKNQSYRPDYVKLGSQRCCTRCRPTNPDYREVTATHTQTNGWSLDNACRVTH